ncbi:MAG TPA: VWA domain-containing protein, partial [Nitratifractor sp.]|nr:VWA domain-containing protein [Nitratifractor sp.]
TALYEALFLGADLFKKSSRKNRVMILLTDGLNTVKSVSLENALERIKQNNIKVYTIALGEQGDYNKEVLEKIAKSSGGEFYEALKPQELALIYSEINKLEATKIEGESKTLYTHYFYYPLILALILMFIYGALYYGSYNRLFFALAIIFILITLYRPTSSQKGTTPKKSGSFAIAIDLSYAMDAKDIYPNRLAFAKAKIKRLLKELSGQKVALYAYAKGGFLITPATDDYERLRYLVENLQPVGIERERANLNSLLKSVATVGEEKSILLFSATDDKFDQSTISFAQEHTLKIYLYGVATEVGTVVKEDGQTLLRNGEIHIFRLNEKMESLASKTGGSYWHYSLGDDINKILDKIETKQEQAEDSKSQRELFFIPLIIATLFFFLSLFGRRFR